MGAVVSYETCRNGHGYTPENTGVRPDGTRRCRACTRESTNRYRAVYREEARNRKREVTIPLPPMPTIADPEGWREMAACASVGGEAFFPEGTQNGITRAILNAKAICATCPVKAMCLEAGLEERYGIWAGTTPTERKQLRKQRK